MKKLIILCFCLLFCITSFAQWTGEPSNVTVTAMRPLFAKNAAVTDSFGVGKMLLFDSCDTRLNTTFYLKHSVFVNGNVTADTITGYVQNADTSNYADNSGLLNNKKDTAFVSTVNDTLYGTYLFKSGGIKLLQLFANGNIYGSQINTDTSNVFIGKYSGSLFNPSLLSNCADYGAEPLENTAIGVSSLRYNIRGRDNTAVGFEALKFDTGCYNTGVGKQTLMSNIGGNHNAAFGGHALYLATNCNLTTAIGVNALRNTLSCTGNTVVGEESMGFSSGTSDYNVAIGYFAYNKSAGGSGANVAVGANSMANSTSAENCTALGGNASKMNINGNAITSIGYSAGYSNLLGYGIYLGNSAGYHDLRYQGFVVDNQLRSSAAKEQTHAILWGQMATDSSQQTLRINASASIYGKLTVTDTLINLKGIKTPILIGGNTTTSTLKLFPTTAAGTTGADIIFSTGTNGGTEQLRINNNGNWTGNLFNISTASPYNSFLATIGGKEITTGERNTSVGFESLRLLTSGNYNTCYGYQTGELLTTQHNNTLIGASSGQNLQGSSTENTFIGADCGYGITGGSYNTFTGYSCGGLANSGNYNSYYGRNSGIAATGSYCSFFGTGSGNNSINSSYSSFFGYESGAKNTGSYSVFLGALSGGDDNTPYPDADSCIFIGYGSGYDVREDYILIIENSKDTINPLITGYMGNSTTNRLVINDDVDNADSTIRINGGGHFTRGLKIDANLTSASFINENIVMGNTLTLTNNTPDTIFKITFPTDSTTYGNSVSGEISYTVTVRGTNGTQIEKGIIQFAGTTYLGVVTTDIGIDVSRQVVSSGTLVITPTLTYDATTRLWYVKINSNSSLTTPSTKVEWNVITNNNNTFTNY